MREAAREAGRDPYDVLTFLGATVIVAATSAEARELRDEYRRYIDASGQLALVSGWTGIDLSGLSLDDPLAFRRTNAIRSTVENLTRAERPTLVRDLLDFTPAGARARWCVGSANEVADELLSWVDETDVDGFNLVRTVMPESLDAVVNLLVPDCRPAAFSRPPIARGRCGRSCFPDAVRNWPTAIPAPAFAGSDEALRDATRPSPEPHGGGGRMVALPLAAVPAACSSFEHAQKERSLSLTRSVIMVEYLDRY